MNSRSHGLPIGFDFWAFRTLRRRLANSACRLTTGQSFRLRTCIETSNLDRSWRHPLALDGFTRAVPLSTQGELHGDQHPARTLRLDPGVQPLVGGRESGCLNSLQNQTPRNKSQLSKLSVSIRGKLQFMDYLVRAALADAQRYQDENDPGTRIFIRQLVEMHAANLRLESQNMRLVGDLCSALESMVDASADSHARGDLQ